MKTRLLAAIVAAVMAGRSAYAADFGSPVKAPIFAPQPQLGWRGCYVGVDAGLGDGHIQWTDTQPDGNIDGNVGTAQTAHTGMSGGVVGGQLGCDMQFGGIVAGIAGSISGSDMAGTNQDQFNAPWTLHDDIDWYATATGRIGMAFNNVLLYAKGGAAFAHNNFEIENSGVALGTPSDIAFGWTAGAGIEWAFAPNWSAVIDASYYGFGRQTETFNNAAAVAGGFVNPPFTINVNPSFETFTLGVNYRFAGSL